VDAGGRRRRGDQQVGAKALDGEIQLGFELAQPLEGGGGDGVDGAGIEEGAFGQLQGVGHVLESALLHRRPVLVEAGPLRRGVQQAHPAPEQLAEEGVHIVLAAAEPGAAVVLAGGDQHRRQGRRRRRFLPEAGPVAQQALPEPRVLGAGHPAAGVVPEGIGPVPPDAAGVHVELAGGVPEH